MKKALLLISLLDAVTGATYSSEGIISNVRAGIACYLESKGKE